MIQEKLVDFTTLPNSQPGTKFIGFDLDGKLKSKDSSGTIAEVGTSNNQGLITQINAQDLIDLEALTGAEFLPTTAGKISIATLKSLFTESLFLDGLVFIGVSTELTSEHENKYLFIGDESNTPIILTMPNSAIFTGGKVGMYFITKGGFNLSYNSPIIYPAIKQTLANEPNSLAQQIRLISYFDDEFLISRMAIMNTADAVVLDEDGTSNTSTNYLLSKVENINEVELNLDDPLVFDISTGILTVPNNKQRIILKGTTEQGVVTITNIISNTKNNIRFTKNSFGTYFTFQQGILLNKNFGNATLYLDRQDYIKYEFFKEQNTFQATDYYTYD